MSEPRHAGVRRKPLWRRLLPEMVPAAIDDLASYAIMAALIVALMIGVWPWKALVR